MTNQDRLRIELIQRLCSAPADTLHEIERLLAQIDSAATDRQAIVATAPLISTPPTAPQHTALQPDRPPRDWPHAPLHRLSEHGTYFVTAGTLYKEHFFHGPEGLDLLESKLLTVSKQHSIQLEAWAVFSNHYHFVGHTMGPDHELHEMLSHLHTATASELNLRDQTPQRTVWHNFWDTQLTFERSYLARLNYVHQNPVKHGLVPVANQYRWCSAAWFEQIATHAQVKTIYGFKIDKVHVHDDFDPI